MSKPTFTVATHAFRAALATAKPFAYLDADVLPWLSVVCLRPADDGIEVTATDRCTISYETIKCTGEPFTVLIPLPIVRRVLDLLPGGRDVDGTTGITALKNERVRIDVGGDHNTSLTFTPETGDYPTRQAMAERIAKLSGQEPASTVHIYPEVLNRACRALAGRRFPEPVKVAFSAATGPVLITGDGVTIAVMPARVDPEPT
ncbi:hypothetical protein ACFVH6_22215 [Spirillospora sp. NPDC127200]